MEYIGDPIYRFWATPDSSEQTTTPVFQLVDFKANGTINPFETFKTAEFIGTTYTQFGNWSAMTTTDTSQNLFPTFTVLGSTNADLYGEPVFWTIVTLLTVFILYLIRCCCGWKRSRYNVPSTELISFYSHDPDLEQRALPPIPPVSSPPIPPVLPPPIRPQCVPIAVESDGHAKLMDSIRSIYAERNKPLGVHETETRF